MIRYLIKNNFKLMFRNKWVLACLNIGPLLIIAILSSAFSDLMQSYEGTEDFKAGYRIEEESIFDENMEAIKEAGKEAGITFLEYPAGEPKEVIENNGLAGFVEFGVDDYTIYVSADYKTEGISLEYFMDRTMRAYAGGILQAMFPETEKKAVKLPVKEISYMPAVDSKDYYGIIYIVYFAWCGIICLANVLGNEKKYGIDRKFQVTTVSPFKIYLAKWMSAVLIVSVGLGIATILTIFLFDIHWGNALLSAGLLLLNIMASIAFGLMFYYLFHNIAMTIIAVFISAWTMGFFGGSFETYMYCGWSDMVKNLSPIYHANRALVEISCMGYSTYTVSCILYMSAITVICCAIAMMADKIRKRGRA